MIKRWYFIKTTVPMGTHSKNSFRVYYYKSWFSNVVAALAAGENLIIQHTDISRNDLIVDSFNRIK